MNVELEKMNQNLLDEADAAELKAAALVEWARKARACVEVNRGFMKNGAPGGVPWTFNTPTSVKVIEANMRRRKNTPAHLAKPRQPGE